MTDDHTKRTHHNHGEQTKESVTEVDRLGAKTRAADANRDYDECPQCGREFLGVNMARNGDLAFIHDDDKKCTKETDVDHVYLKMDGLELTQQQSKRARDVLEQVKNGDATHATDLIDEWKGAPPDYTLERMANVDGRGEVGTVYGWISVSDIAGTDPELTGRFEKGRIESVLQLMIDGQYRPEHVENHGMPHYREICGDLYVGSDGNHRSIACKAIGIDKIYAQITEYDVNETEYQRWKARRDGELVDTMVSDTSRGPSDPPEHHTDLLREVLAAVGSACPPTTNLDELVYTPDSDVCDTCGRSSHYLFDYVVEDPRNVLGVEETVLIGEFAHVTVDCALRKLDFAVDLEVAHFALASRVERREQPQTATSGGRTPQ
ncbi:hypothetical protein [Halococcus sediminicola]|uniref:hypothetical protein n=1 Tax=Halococcus sediminicola TaxID=1264579 RepID=UPI000AD4218A|nr:hypothetical protein [Halococcus sediminicola]